MRPDQCVIRSVLTAVVAAGMLSIPAGPAWAAATPATAEIIQVTATSAGHSATFEAVFPVGSVIEDEFTWTLPAPTTLSADGVDLAELNELEVTFQADPRIVLGFDCRNSSQSDELYVFVQAARIVFTEIPDAQAKAWAQVSVTDAGGVPENAYAHNAGTIPYDMLYQARYSTHPIVDTRTVFADLVSEFDTDFGQTVGMRLPSSGYSNLNTSVYMMQSEFEFLLSPGDRANGLSNYEIIPEPATLCGGLMVAFMLLARRRR